jgi:glycosyltransferase involved in cell wall biosynthesis
MTPRVALDKRSVGWGQGTGIRRYRDALRRCIEENSDLFTPPQLLADGAEPGAATTRVGPRAFADAQKWFTLTGRQRSVTLDESADIFHWSHPMPLWAKGVLNVVTIHDLIPIDQPEYSAIPPRRFRRLLTALASKGACFICVSEATRDALIAATGINPRRAVCTWQPVATPSGEGALPAGLERGRYILLLGTVEPRKNVLRALQAWRVADTGLTLVVAGPDGHWPDRRQRAAITRELAHPNIIRLPWLEDAAVAALIANSRALLMPSLAEGFGLPPVEALLASVPAIASNSPLSREILGDAALLVDPFDVGAIADAIRRTADAPATPKRDLPPHFDRYGDAAFARRLRLAYDQFLQLGGPD